MNTQEQITTYWRLWFDAIKAQDITKAVRCRRAIDVLTRQQNAARGTRYAQQATRRALAGLLPCLAVLAMMVGCTAQVDPATSPTAPATTDVCDRSAVDWDAAECVGITAQGTYAPDVRFVCPQADGTEWAARTATAEDGTKVVLYEHYVPWGGTGTPAAHIPNEQLCLETPDGQVLVRR